jgi:hypothetical protein
MYQSQILELRSPVDLKVYKLPLKMLTAFDIEREVFIDENGEIVLESPKNKRQRVLSLYKMEKNDNKPIINIDTNGGDYDAAKSHTRIK